MEKITQITNFVYESEDVPEEKLTSSFIVLMKKARTIECKTYRTINLMSHVMKIILRVVLNRIKDTIRRELSEDQFGYRPGKGTRNAILCLRSLMEKRIEKQKTCIYVVLIM